MGSKFRYFDWYLLLLLVILLGVGILVIYTASSTKIGEEILTHDYYVRQIIWIGIVAVTLIVLYKTPYSFFDFLVTPSYIISIVMLIIVLFMPAIKGSSRWIIFGSFRVQPSEIAKITTILMLAKSISKSKLSDFNVLIRALLIAGVPVSLIVMQPDLGTSLVFVAIVVSMLAFSKLPSYYFVILLSPVISVMASFFPVSFIFSLAIIGFLLYKLKLTNLAIVTTLLVNIGVFISTPYLWDSLKEYQRNRILTFFNPGLDPLGAGYQIIQSRIAVGSGGLFGKGFLEGTQKNLHFLPEHHTDFIFSVLAEEFGFIGCAVLILLLYLFLSRMIRSLSKINFPDRRLATIGIISYLSFQITVNLMINLGLFPTTGIPLPFISYGGSNLVVNCLSVGIIMKFLIDRSFLK